MIEDYLNRQIESKSQSIGIGGFKLFARVRETTNLKSRAPSTYLEDGSPVQEHIINEPLTIQIEGDVGDIYIEKTAIESQINDLNEVVGQAAQFLPQRTQSQIQQANAIVNTFRDKVREIDNAITVGKNVLGIQPSNESLQEQFFNAMEAYHNSKLLISIEMQYRNYFPMRITDLTIVKDASGTALRFNMTAQKIRFAEPIYILNSQYKKNPAGSVSGQTSGQEDKGAQTGKEPNPSLLTRGLNALGL